MLKGILISLICLSGFGLTTFAYGKDGIDAMKKLGFRMIGPMICIYLLFPIWLIFLAVLFSGSANRDFWLSLFVSILLPALYVIWVIHARKKKRWALSQLEAIEKEEREALAKKKEEKQKFENMIAEQKAYVEAKRVSSDIQGCTKDPTREGYVLCLACGKSQRSGRNVCFQCGALFDLEEN